MGVGMGMGMDMGAFADQLGEKKKKRILNYCLVMGRCWAGRERDGLPLIRSDGISLYLLSWGGCLAAA